MVQLIFRQQDIRKVEQHMNLQEHILLLEVLQGIQV